jgi:hypothetical protein
MMQLPMMTAAERYGEFVADFETQCSGLRKPQVMRIGRLLAANEPDIEARISGGLCHAARTEN